MRTFVRLSVPAVALMMAGCFFDNPLTSGPSEDVNTWLLGIWEHTGNNGKSSRVMVTPVGGDRYAVRVTLPGQADKRPKRYEFEGWSSRVGDTSFLTLRCLESPGDIPVGAHLPVQVQLLDQNNIRVRGLALDAPPSSSAYQLRKEIRGRLKERTLYAKEATNWRRIEEIYWSTDGADPAFKPLRNPGLDAPPAPQTKPPRDSDSER